MKTIKQVSQLSGASVRTLQYYDNIHLLSPSRTASSYRLYSDDDIAKLRQILLLKELSFSLKEIRGVINNPDSDRSAVFHNQKELLSDKRQQASRIIRILERLENGASLDDCAKDINSLVKESKSMNKSLKLLLLIITPIILGVGVFGAYQLSRRQDDSVTDIPSSAVADTIYINPVVSDGLHIYIFDTVEVSPSELPENSPILEQIAFPQDLQDHVQLKAFYTHDHGPDDQVCNYQIDATDLNYEAIYYRYVLINFLPNRMPLRDMYIPDDGEPSIIDGHIVKIGSKVQKSDKNSDYVEYYIDFTVDNINYNVETHGLSETEMITLIKSLL